MEDPHTVRQETERICVVSQGVAQGVDEIVVGLEQAGSLASYAALVSGQALERCLSGRIFAGVPNEEPGAWIIWVGFVDVAEAMAFELGVVIYVVDVVEMVDGVDGGFDGGVEGESQGVHCSAAFDCQVLCC